MKKYIALFVLLLTNFFVNAQEQINESSQAEVIFLKEIQTTPKSLTQVEKKESIDIQLVIPSISSKREEVLEVPKFEKNKL